jgi:GT2 family glycosyltransferase
VLILDDDAVPDAAGLSAAVDLLDRRPDLAAVALHPRHPQTKASEWPFAEGRNAKRKTQSAHETKDPRICDVRCALFASRWPIMGCGNLVRRDAWEQVGGYDEAFFLYRNDVDLAMKLLSAGYGVHFDPAWVVWHDSPAGAGGSKSQRWFELGMRNWVWLCRRHGRGTSGLLALLSGWLWAHRLAGCAPRSHARIIRGIWRGWAERPPALPEVCRHPGLGGRAMRDLMHLRFKRRP